MTKSPRLSATAIDLFCGAGGLTRGLLDAGVNVAAGYDIDKRCRFPYEYNNPGATFHHESITDLTAPNHALCDQFDSFTRITEREGWAPRVAHAFGF